MKRILGLDIGTNSIGWAIVSGSEDDSGVFQLNKIEAAGSRIIPMDAATLGSFNKGISVSPTKDRTDKRSTRRMIERCHQRRERLHRVLRILGFLPEHYDGALDRYGKIKEGEEPKLAWSMDKDGKYQFLFMEAFNEMLEDFQTAHPELAGKKIPMDWTIYYLRKKALNQRISKEELAWILLNFNQKRGYYQRGEEDSETDDNMTVQKLKVIDVVKTGKDKKTDKYWFDVVLENGDTYRAAFYNDIYSWKSEYKEFIVTTTVKNGVARRSYSVLPSTEEIERMSEKDKYKLYAKIKIRNEKEVESSGKTVGTYIYDTILQMPDQKVRGKLVRTIERKFYKDELIRILDKQTEFHPELQDKELYNECVEELYNSNDAHRRDIANKNFTYLFVDDILFYHRPLKTKKSLVANCPYEVYAVGGETSENKKTKPVKCIAKSHPLYQEFRLWQFLSNLRIYKVELVDDVDVTRELLKTEEDYVALFDWMNEKEKINQEDFLNYPAFKLGKSISGYRWNHVTDKSKYHPCNETRAKILSHLAKAGISADFLTREMEYNLWLLLYSVNDKDILKKALKTFADKYSLGNSFVDVFHKFPAFKKEYGAYSVKAINKLLPLMRMGRYWSQSDKSGDVLCRIEKMISGEYDAKIKNKVREKTINLTHASHFRGLPLWLACYVVYDRHSESKDAAKWNTPDDLKNFLYSFNHHSLRNPIVEQVVVETLRTVHDIWKKYGKIDEIHVELGREMKNPADKRNKITQQTIENENTNLRIKTLLMEFANPEFGIKDVRPNSPSQQDILRIYEEGVWNSVDKIPDDIAKIIKKFNENNVEKRPTRNEFLRYKLWLEQKYCSPYTRKVIPLAELFTPAYEIEHIIPKARYFDDSFSNKVICESAVNKEKDKMLALEFIKNNEGRIIELGNGKTVKIATEGEYTEFVKETYGKNRTKLRKLLMEDIPDDFIERQLNDSRYISKLVMGLLSNIVREEEEEEAISKNVVVCTGGVTDRLKKDWGINDVWNRIILPRFLRLDEMMGKGRFTTLTANGHLIPSMPLELQKGFSKKRIDHRHHAMDAIVIACVDRNRVNYLNNESARGKATISRHDLQNLLCNKVKTDDKGNYVWVMKKPWNTFTQDVYEVLNNIIVSFKYKLRVIGKRKSKYVHFVDGKKKVVGQKNVNWVIRKPLHKATLCDEVNLRKDKPVSLKVALSNPSRIVDKELKRFIIEKLAEGYDEKRLKQYFEEHKDVWPEGLSKIQVYYYTKETKDRFFAYRKAINEDFDEKYIKGHVTDTGIQQILLRHLQMKGGNPKVAFSPEGIAEMNRNIVQLNKGKHHHPIWKVRYYEKGEKFAVGAKGIKSSQFVEAAGSTNLYFAIYNTEVLNKKTGKMTKKRTYATIPLNVVIDRLKQGLSAVPADENGNEPLYILSPNDLVYVSSLNENEEIDKKHIYKIVSFTGHRLYGVPYSVANSIVDKIEYSQLNKVEFTDENISIKELCVPVKVDRLGNITKIG